MLLKNLKEIYSSLEGSSFIISKQKKKEFKSFIESSDQLKRYLNSRKITLENILRSLDTQKNYSKTKHDLILSFSMFKINKKFEKNNTTFLIEPEYRHIDCLLNSPDLVCCIKDKCNFSLEVKTKLDKLRIEKALKQIENSFKFDPKCNFGFITTMKKKELKLFPVVEVDKFDEGEFKVYEKFSNKNILIIKKL